MLDALLSDPKQRYPEPLHLLLTLGDPARFEGSLLDEQYEKLGANLIPALLNMLTDRALWWTDSSDALCWAPIHAAAALARLRAAEATIPMLRITGWAAQRKIDAAWQPVHWLSKLGPAALPDLMRFTSDRLNPDPERAAAFEVMALIAEGDVSHRPAVVQPLTEELAEAGLHHPRHNGAIVNLLVALGVKESAELIERAFMRDLVAGADLKTWGNVRRELGVPGLGLATEDAGASSDLSNDGVRRPAPRGLSPVNYHATRLDQRREKRKRQRSARPRKRR